MSEERIPGARTDAIESAASVARQDGPQAGRVVGVDRNPQILGYDRNPRVYVGDGDSRSVDAARYHLRDDDPAQVSLAEAEEAAAASRAALGIGSSLQATAAKDARFAQLASDNYYTALAQPELDASQAIPSVAQSAQPPVKPAVQRPSESASRQPVLGRWTQRVVESFRGGQSSEQGRY